MPSEVITDIVPDDTGASRRPETSNASSTVIAARVSSEVITDIVPDDTGGSRRPEPSDASSTVIAAVVCCLKPLPILSQMILMVLVVLKQLMPIIL